MVKKLLASLVFCVVVGCSMFASSTGTTFDATLGWNKVDQPEVVGYRVHYGLTQGFPKENTKDVGDVDEATIEGLETGVNYYFVVTSLNQYGYQSNPSNEVWTNGIYSPGMPGPSDPPSDCFIDATQTE